MPVGCGTRLGKYEVQDVIGEGAMGVVYRAYHVDLERTAAVKVMQALTPDPVGIARFRHEAQAIAALRHPNVIDVYDYGEYEGTPYMVVEYIPGGNLADRMADGRLDTATALKYLRGIAAGLDYAHGRGVVHRDVKPANVLLSADDTPVLADFGLAKLLQGSSLRSVTGITTGTPAYMAPEQVEGRHVGPAADNYSLATIAYEMLTGVIPFDGEAVLQLLYAQVNRVPVTPSSRHPVLGAAVDSVIMRGLAKDPSARWESATLFVDALAMALALPATQPLPSAVRTLALEPPVASTVRVPPPATAVVVQPRTEMVPAPAMPAPRSRRRLYRGVVLGAAAAVVLTALLGLCQTVGATTLSVSPTTVAQGQDVNVSAANVPASQSGTIELHSIVRTYQFRADAQGRVNTFITVPQDVDVGDHTVSICWSGSCHASTTLRIVAGSVNPSPSPSPSPSPTPSTAPVATPTPTTNPCPAESPVLTAPPATAAASSTITVSGQGFTPSTQITVSLSGAVTGSKTITSSASGAFSVSFTVPLLATGNATATATDACGRTASRNFTIVAGL